METMSIVNMYNNEKMSLQEIGEKIGASKSTIQRRLSSDGWKYDKVSKKYVNIDDNKNNETIKQESNIENETINIVNRTYGIPEDIDRALKIKSAIEGKKVIDVVREALRNAIEDKYFNF